MFDFAWSEIALIAAVALIAIGPKDMPAAIRTVSGLVKKARRMAAEFQTHVDEMIREANLDEIKNQINEIRHFDVKTEIERAIDPDGSLQNTFADNPMHPVAAPELLTEVAVSEPAVLPPAEAEPAAAPAFIPPELVPPTPVWIPAIAGHAEAPAFIPPGFASSGSGSAERTEPRSHASG